MGGGPTLASTAKKVGCRGALFWAGALWQGAAVAELVHPHPCPSLPLPGHPAHGVQGCQLRPGPVLVEMGRFGPGWASVKNVDTFLKYAKTQV